MLKIDDSKYLDLEHTFHLQKSAFWRGWSALHFLNGMLGMMPQNGIFVRLAYNH